MTTGLGELFAAGQLEHVSAMMPPDLRGELDLAGPRAGLIGEQRTPEHTRLDLIEHRLATLTEAVTELVRGLEEPPTEEPFEGRTARAAQDAHRILLASGAVEG